METTGLISCSLAYLSAHLQRVSRKFQWFVWPVHWFLAMRHAVCTCLCQDSLQRMPNWHAQVDVLDFSCESTKASQYIDAGWQNLPVQGDVRRSIQNNFAHILQLHLHFEHLWAIVTIVLVRVFCYKRHQCGIRFPSPIFPSRIICRTRLVTGWQVGCVPSSSTRPWSSRFPPVLRVASFHLTLVG